MVTVVPNKSRGCYCLRERTDEIKEMFEESEGKYIRIHGMEKRRWLRCEIVHQRG
jgi:hypothetical protein